MIPVDQWEWYGAAMHFICGHECRFHLATEVGPWLVSTVGEYLPRETTGEILARTRGIDIKGRLGSDEWWADYMQKIGYEDIGYGRKYETMVFRIVGRCEQDGCNCPRPDWSELCMNGYSTRIAATRGHNEMCRQWADITVEEHRKRKELE